MTVTIRPLAESEWSAAMELTARAFLYEPFIVGLLGADPVARYPLCRDRYTSLPWDPDGDSVGAFSDGLLIGAVGVDRAGHCHQCHSADQPDFITGQISTYARNVSAVHARQDPAHGWLGRVAVEPTLHGNGVGGLLVSGALEHLAARGTDIALLDAELHRVSYYEPWGFTVIEHFSGSVSNNLALMRWTSSGN